MEQKLRRAGCHRPEDLVSYKAVSPPEMPANQIQDHSQLREKSGFEDEDDEDDLRAATA